MISLHSFWGSWGRVGLLMDGPKALWISRQHTSTNSTRKDTAGRIRRTVDALQHGALSLSFRCFAFHRLIYSRNCTNPFSFRCDRILSHGKGMRQLSYRRAELDLSDHRPVTATYMAEVEVFSPRRLQRALTLTDAEIEKDDVATNFRIESGICSFRADGVSRWYSSRMFTGCGILSWTCPFLCPAGRFGLISLWEADAKSNLYDRDAGNMYELLSAAFWTSSLVWSHTLHSFYSSSSPSHTYDVHIAVWEPELMKICWFSMQVVSEFIWKYCRVMFSGVLCMFLCSLFCYIYSG